MKPGNVSQTCPKFECVLQCPMLYLSYEFDKNPYVGPLQTSRCEWTLHLLSGGIISVVDIVKSSEIVTRRCLTFWPPLQHRWQDSEFSVSSLSCNNYCKVFVSWSLCSLFLSLSDRVDISEDTEETIDQFAVLTSNALFFIVMFIFAVFETYDFFTPTVN